VNSQIAIRARAEDFNPVSAERLSFDGPDGAPAPRPGVLLDGTDNLATRYLLNDVAVKHGVPFVYGGAVGTEGAAMTIRPGETPCLRCLFPEPPPPGTLPTCDTAGVLAPVATIVAACQAADALRILLGQGNRIAPTLLSFDIWRGQRRRLDLSGARDPACPCCVQRRFAFLDAGVSDAASMCGREAVQVLPMATCGKGAVVDLAALASRLSAIGVFSASEHLLRGELPETGDQGRPLRLTVFADGRALVHGTRDLARARGVYARYIGS
jgi:adenylyltransferase/sulfurtransferase